MDRDVHCRTMPSGTRFASVVATALLFAELTPGQDPAVFQAPPFVEDTLEVDAAFVQQLILPPGDPDDLTVRLRFDGKEHVLSLRAHDVRSPDFRLLVDDGRALRQMPRPKSVTYRGELAGEPGSAVAATIVDGQLRAEMLLRGKTWTVQPASDAAKGMPRAAHLVFEREKVRPTPFGCTTLGTALRSAPLGTAPETAAATGLQVAELAIDADFPFFVNRGFSVVAVQDDITGIINAANVIYTRDLGIEHEITAIIVRSVPTYLTDGETLLFEFQLQWLLFHADIPRDIAHLFSGRAALSTVGVAYLRSVCDPLLGFGVSWSDFSANQALRIGVTAHELGHGWGADHCDAFADCRIMCSFVAGCSGDVTSFSPTSLLQIESFGSSLGCLSQGEVPGSVSAFGMGCAGSAGTPDLGPPPGQLPWLGEPFSLELTNLPAASVPLLLVGVSNTTWGALTLPAPLDSFGMPGCVGYTSADAAAPLVNLSGVANYMVDIPDDPALLGRTLYFQAAVPDPAANTFGATVSNAVEVTFGIR